MTLRTPDHCLITRDSIEHALDIHEVSGNIIRWLNWHEPKPSRKRPLYTITLNGGTVLDIATLWEAHALCAGLASASVNSRGTLVNKQEAMQHGLGYAAGREDASGIRTVSPTEAPGFLVFAEEYAKGWDDFNLGKSHYMTNSRDAYDTWQATNGATIFSTSFAAFDSGPRKEG